MVRSKPVRPVSMIQSIRLTMQEASSSEGRRACDLQVGALAAAPVNEVQVRFFLADQRDIWSIEVRPLPVLVGLMSYDVGELPDRPDLKANCFAVSDLL